MLINYEQNFESGVTRIRPTIKPVKHWNHVFKISYCYLYSKFSFINPFLECGSLCTMYSDTRKKLSLYTE